MFALDLKVRIGSDRMVGLKSLDSNRSPMFKSSVLVVDKSLVMETDLVTMMIMSREMKVGWSKKDVGDA